ncbi:hypothetical protein CH252_20965 [Rhodococcus sp. 06-1477-1B]|nr:hypothetical protein CH252_20965 [Rhodococcus sp. 06-1477-1B]
MSDEEVWTDEDSAAVQYESLPPWHPSLFVDVFRLGLQQPLTDEIRFQLRTAFVTPESAAGWDDFFQVQDIAQSDLKISMTPLYGKGAPDVAYVRLVATDKWVSRMEDETDRIYATLVWRPDLPEIVPQTAWRIHHIGEPIDPADLPRTAPGIDPR